MIIVKNKIDIKNIKKINDLIQSIEYLSTSNNKNLRTENISKLSSIIATDSKIRNFINKQQRKIIKEKMLYFKGCVVDGRDIGSNVFKNAKIKLYIEVKPEIRAKRRHKQLIEIGEKSIYSEILKEINLRDQIDKSRNIAPLIIPKGAFIVDNSHIFRKTIKCINQIIKKFI